MLKKYHNHKKKIKWGLVIGVITIVLSAGTTVVALAFDSGSKAQKISTNQVQIKEIKGSLKETKEKQEKLTSRTTKVETNIQNIQQSIKKIEKTQQKIYDFLIEDKDKDGNSP